MRYSKWPSGLLNVIFYPFVSIRQGDKWVFHRSSLVKKHAWWRGTNAASRSGRGYLFLIVISLRP